MVDDVNFMHASARDGDLVEHRVVVDAVAMHPIGAASSVSCASSIIDVDAFGMVSNHPVVVFGGVVILDEVIPCMPSPHDVGAVVAHRLNLDDVIGPNVVLATG